MEHRSGAGRPACWVSMDGPGHLRTNQEAVSEQGKCCLKHILPRKVGIAHPTLLGRKPCGVSWVTPHRFLWAASSLTGLCTGTWFGLWWTSWCQASSTEGSSWRSWKKCTQSLGGFGKLPVKPHWWKQDQGKEDTARDCPRCHSLPSWHLLIPAQCSAGSWERGRRACENGET